MSIGNFIRSLKVTYSLYNLFQFSKLKHIRKEYSKRGISKPYFANVQAEDFKILPEDEHPWLDLQNSRDALPSNPSFKLLKPEIQESLLSWSDKGYVILENFFTGQTIGNVNKDIDDLLNSGKVEFKWRNKIMFAMRESETINSMASDTSLTSILQLLLGKEVIPFQSINFITGSEQKAHSDSIHMTTHPMGYLIAVWIALEDIDETNGPLFYYPGSHKLPYVMNSDFDHGGNKFMIGENSYKRYEEKIAAIITSNTYEKKIFKAKKGDVLIWHANLLHGGDMVKDKSRTRKSMVFHYYAKDVICYHEITQRPALIEVK